MNLIIISIRKITIYEILHDTNIILDIFLVCKPFVGNAANLFAKGEQKQNYHNRLKISNMLIFFIFSFQTGAKVTNHKINLSKNTNPSLNKSEKHVLKLLNIAFSTVIIVIAILTAAGYFLILHTIDEQKNSANIINIAGRQKMLSQRLALLGTLLLDSKEESQKSILQGQFKSALEIFEESHRSLVNGDPEIGITPPQTKEMKSLYFGTRSYVDRDVRNLIGEVQVLLLLYSRKTLGQESTTRVKYLHNLQLITLISILFMLFLSAMVVFLPMSKIIYRHFIEIHTAGKNMERAKLEAEEANRAKSNFLANMSHEIPTPMNAIIGLTHLAMKTDLNEKQLDYIEKTHNSAHSFLHL